ncbi:diguanylate cyclase/phosphodiesterase (GGDEF & EAL domains) with PAS/PAC sensor(s) [Euzebya pacifica]|uniref:Diguanylate cyclase/phosphodiesterase (GGDEF & EAL domains) with PAS/PAC sensor(S) n=1 Tax=Euzebya pacifica TaxID=1608957 RepID=A0A346Y2N2_9ACTN|nr:bifunctional diguanylate cyclase/phosphodiesterase [Euzebya pacifica]AXV08729.1 diguanylate cyclase/phosphodiesterase (GGDEF & EAL domains) with PAS/PAC sensor(s) [Euzebya pacifica]
MSLRVTRRERAWGPQLLPAIVGGVVAAGVLACVHAAVVGANEGWMPNAPWLAAVLFASMVIAEVRPLQTIRAGDDSIITVSLAYSCALVFVLPGFGATLAVAAGTLFADVVNRAAPQKAAFNTAMMALSIHLGTFVLRAGGAQDLVAADPRDPMLLVTLLMAFVVIYSAATILVALVLSAVEEDSPIAVLRRDFFSTLPSDGMLLPLGPVLVVVGIHDPVLLPLAMVLTAVVHTSTRISTERERDATEDSLTGLLNRRALEQEAEAGLDRAARSGRRVVVLLMDLNRFKVINDTWGHHAGDEVIVEIARRLRDRMPTAALVARLGGDEFAVVLVDASSEAAVEMAEVASEVFVDPVEVDATDGVALEVTGAIGVATSGPGWSRFGELTRAADAAMYAGKRRGLPYLLADPDSSDGHHIQALERAIDSDEMHMDFQPLVDARTEAVMGFETLARWNHPQHGPIPPWEFVRDLEATGVLMGRFTERVLRDAVTMVRRLHDNGHPVSISVNVSPLNLADPDFVDTVLGTLDRHAIESRWLVLEITETALMSNLPACRRALRRLVDSGVGVSLDDFGSGHSSLAMIKDIPLTELKIDRSFVTNTDDERGVALLRTLVDLARIHGLRSIAEGVEDRATLHALAEIGFDQVQGYGIGRPLGADETLAWMSGRASLDPSGLHGMDRIVLEQ